MNYTRYFAVFAICLFFTTNAIGQTKAVTEKGDTIFVYDNGTWSYELLAYSPVIDDLAFMEKELDIDTLSTKFKYPKAAKKELKNSLGQFVFRYNENLWKRVPPATLNEESEFAFMARESDVWCVIISEETSMPSETLFKIAINNMEESIGSDLELLSVQLRDVNGAKVIRGLTNPNYSGIEFIFEGYYFSNEKGAVQLISWTGANAYERNKQLMQDWLNGFVVE